MSLRASRPHGRRDAGQPLAVVPVGDFVARIDVSVEVRRVENGQSRRRPARVRSPCVGRTETSRGEEREQGVRRERVPVTNGVFLFLESGGAK